MRKLFSTELTNESEITRIVWTLQDEVFGLHVPGFKSSYVTIGCFENVWPIEKQFLRRNQHNDASLALAITPGYSPLSLY